MFSLLERCDISGIIHSGPNSNRITHSARYYISITTQLVIESIQLWSWIDSGSVDTVCPVNRDKPGTDGNEGYTESFAAIKRFVSQSPLHCPTKAPQLSINKQNKELDAGSWLCPLNKSPPTLPPKNLKRWHCGVPLVCSWWPVRSVWREWAGVEAGGLDSNMQWH